MATAASLVHSADNAADQTVYSFASAALGATGSDRRNVVAVMARTASTTLGTPTVKVGGVTCTEIVSAQRNSAGVSYAGLWAVPAGYGDTLENDTSATVEITFNQTMVRCAVDVYRVLGATTLFAWQTATSIAGSTTGTAAIDVPAGGCAIGAQIAIGTGSSAATWTNLTERTDRNVESLVNCSSAEDDFAAEQMGRSVSCNTSGGSAAVFVVASWTSRWHKLRKANEAIVIPAGVPAIRFDTIGPGGNVARNSATSASKPPGGSGAAQGVTFPATPGETWNLTVPAGGAASALAIAAATGATRTLSTDYGRNGAYNTTTATLGGKSTNNTRTGHTTLHYSTSGGDSGTSNAGGTGQAGSGGAGGPHGDGKAGGNGSNGSGSAGGGGANGGSSTAGASNSASSAGNAGGASRRGLAGPAGGASGAVGTAGTDGSGGSGSGNNASGRGGAGSMDWVFTDSATGEKAGPGSGAGGAQRNVSAGPTGAGGLYGAGGGGGGGGTGTNVGPGAQALVVSSWEPAPSYVVLPELSGVLGVGGTLVASDGLWIGNPQTFTYQWQRDGVDIDGATASTYTVVSGDASKAIRCVVTAYSPAGSYASAASAAVTIPSGSNQFILGSPRSTFYKGTMGSSRYVGASYGGEWNALLLKGRSSGGRRRSSVGVRFAGRRHMRPPSSRPPNAQSGPAA